MAGQRQVGVDLDPAGPVESRRRSARPRIRPSGEASHAGGPDLGVRRDAQLARRRRRFAVDPVGVDVGDQRAQMHLDTELAAARLAPSPDSRWPKAGISASPASSRTTRALAGSMWRKLRCSERWDELGDLAGHLHAGRARRRRRRRSATSRRSSGSVSRSAISNAPKIRPRSSSASSMLLHARARTRLNSVVAEVGLPGAGRHDQAVVRRPRPSRRACRPSPCGAAGRRR